MRNIEDWVHRRFDEVLPYGSGTDLRVNCPFCVLGDDGHHLHISLVEETCHCFRCDYANSWVGLVMAIESCTFQEALNDVLGGDVDITPLYKLLHRKLTIKGKPRDVMTGIERKPARDPRAYGMPAGFITLDEAVISQSKHLRMNASIACDYLWKRMGVLYTYDKLMERFGAWWGVWKGMQGHGRIVIPVEDGWWTSRSILECYPDKYVSESGSKRGALYNYPALQEHRTVAIAEGAFSAEFIGDNAVALCGKTATPEQLDRLARAKRVEHYVVCLDAGTNTDTAKLADALHHRGKKVDIRVYASGDPASSNTFRQSHWNLDTKLRLSWNLV